MKSFTALVLLSSTLPFTAVALTAKSPLKPATSSTRNTVAAPSRFTTFPDNEQALSSRTANKLIQPVEGHEECLRTGPSLNHPKGRPVPANILQAYHLGTHPAERQEELGGGIFLADDWRSAWHTYQSPPDDPTLIDPHDGYAEYEIDHDTMIEGALPEDLVGVLYRNGPGKLGVNGRRVDHVLDGDGLIVQISIPPPPPRRRNDEEKNEEQKSDGRSRRVSFKSRFVETKGFVEERRAGRFLLRGTFGTSPMGLRGLFGPGLQPGLNEDPVPRPLLSRVFGNAFKTDIKNTANTHVVSFGGKVLALFEAGLPHAIDPITLETLGEDDMGGTLPKGDKLAVKMSDGGMASNIPEEFLPNFFGGAAHTAHPKACPRTGNLVGWTWSQLVDEPSCLEVTFTEWSHDGFRPIASRTVRVEGSEVAPHDMALTENYVVLLSNSLKLDQLAFLSGAKGPAASLSMDGRAPLTAHVFPRPSSSSSSTQQFEPFSVTVPPCFCIHFSHAFEDERTGNIVATFSGWPPSDSTDFLGAWGGFAPDFERIPETYLWRLEIDPHKKETVNLSIARGSANVCVEHPVVHPDFLTRRARHVYAVASNVVGDASAPCGYVRLRVEDGNPDLLVSGERNDEVDAYWFGTRYSAGEPLVVPKDGGDRRNENEAYLLGMVHDAVQRRSFVAVFDLERHLSDGPVCKLWLKSAVPHGLHGCFAKDGRGGTSVFC